MNRNDTLRYEMFLRVKDFGVEHRDEFPESSPAGLAFSAVTSAAAAIEAADAKLQTAQATRRAKAALRDDIVERLTTVARTARLAASTTPDLDAMFQVPLRRADSTLVAAARRFAEGGETASDALARLGLPPAIFTELRDGAGRLAQAVVSRRADKDSRAKAQETLKHAMKGGLDALRTLDVVVGNTLRGNPVLLAAWKRVRRVSPKTKATPADAPLPKAS